MAMEDFRVDIIVGKGPGATAIPLELEPFTLIGATTRAGLLTGPLRDRFGFTGHMEFYEQDELEQVLAPLGHPARRRPARGRRRPRSRCARGARRASPTGCCAGCATTPRCAPMAWSTCRSRTMRWRSTTSINSASTGSTGPSSMRWSAASAGDRSASARIAVAVGEEVETVEEVAEPFLVRAGLLARTPRGRVATPAAWLHLGLTPPAGPASTTGPTLFDPS